MSLPIRDRALGTNLQAEASSVEARATRDASAAIGFSSGTTVDHSLAEETLRTVQPADIGEEAIIVTFREAAPAAGEEDP